MLLKGNADGPVIGSTVRGSTCCDGQRDAGRRRDDGNSRGGSNAMFGLADAIYMPAALLGTWCGMMGYARLSDRQFSIVINAFLMISGFSFIL